MNLERIYFSPPHVGKEEIESVTYALRNGWIAPVGPELDAFEKELGSRLNDKPTLALNSGTAALHLAVVLAGISRGDHVLIGSMTFVAAANAVLFEHGIPVFLDSESYSWNLDPVLLETYLEEHQHGKSFPKAVIVTHIYGRAAAMLRIIDICAKYDVLVIEDAAEAFGTKVSGQSAGSLGDFGVLSFNGNKIITTGGGGALVCKDQSTYERAKNLSMQAKSQADHYLHYERGFNYRLSNILAAIGLSQIRKFDQILDKKRAITLRYQELLEKYFWLEDVPTVDSNFWIFPVLIKRQYLNQVNPSRLVELFEKQNIEVRRFWRPLHSQPLFENAEVVKNGVSDDLFERGVCLPSGSSMTTDQANRILDVIKSVVVKEVDV